MIAKSAVRPFPTIDIMIESPRLSMLSAPFSGFSDDVNYNFVLSNRNFFDFLFCRLE